MKKEPTFGVNERGSEMVVKVLEYIGRPMTRSEIITVLRRNISNPIHRQNLSYKVKDILRLRGTGAQKYTFDIRIMDFPGDEKYYGLYKWEEKSFDPLAFEKITA